MGLSNANPITPDSKDGRGLDFAEWIDDPGLVAAALHRLAENLNPVIAICLRLHPVHGGHSWFEPYGFAQGLNGLANVPSLKLPQKIGYERLLIRGKNGGEEWPELAEWLPGVDPPDHPPEMVGSRWIGQLKLQSNDDFVGYFKVCIPPSDPIPQHQKKRFIDAFELLKNWLPLALQRRREQQKKLNPDYLSALARIHTVVARHILNRKPRRAMQALCTLLTSHVGGAGFNRCIFLAPIESITPDNVMPAVRSLKSVFAIGGDCSVRWAEVQHHVTNQVQTISQLASLIESQTLPVDDPLYKELVTGPCPLSIDTSSASLASQLWGHRGDLSKLPANALLEISRQTEISWPDFIVKEDLTSVILAAVIKDNIGDGAGDPLLQNWPGRSPQSALLANCNHTWFMVPMTFAGQCLGLILCDLGQWTEVNITRNVVPRLLTVRALVDVFAQHFSAVRWS